MPKTEGKVLDAKLIEKDGKTFKAAMIQLNRVLPPKGERVVIKWGSQRTLPQNALYWKYLHWLITEGGLEDQGHFSEDALHIDLKTHLLAEKIMDRGEFKAIEEPSSAILTKSEFSEYFMKVDQFVKEFFSVDTSGFWEDYEKNYKI